MTAQLAEFKASMAFLGYVDVPEFLDEFNKGSRVLVSEWVHGRHLDQLDRTEGLRMTYMAVEVCALRDPPPPSRPHVPKRTSVRQLLFERH